MARHAITLSKQQQRALALTASGLRVYQVADLMGVSVRTVETHLAEGRKKLKAKTTPEAVAIALRTGVIMALTGIMLVNAANINAPDMLRARTNRVRVRTRKELVI